MLATEGSLLIKYALLHKCNYIQAVSILQTFSYTVYLLVGSCNTIANGYYEDQWETHSSNPQIDLVFTLSLVFLIIIQAISEIIVNKKSDIELKIQKLRTFVIVCENVIVFESLCLDYEGRVWALTIITWNLFNECKLIVEDFRVRMILLLLQYSYFTIRYQTTQNQMLVMQLIVQVVQGVCHVSSVLIENKKICLKNNNKNKKIISNKDPSLNNIKTNNNNMAKSSESPRKNLILSEDISNQAIANQIASKSIEQQNEILIVCQTQSFLYECIQNSIQIGIMVVDGQKQVLYSNQKLLSMMDCEQANDAFQKISGLLLSREYQSEQQIVSNSIQQSNNLAYSNLNRQQSMQLQDIKEESAENLQSKLNGVRQSKDDVINIRSDQQINQIREKKISQNNNNNNNIASSQMKNSRTWASTNKLGGGGGGGAETIHVGSLKRLEITQQQREAFKSFTARDQLRSLIDRLLQQDQQQQQQQLSASQKQLQNIGMKSPAYSNGQLDFIQQPRSINEPIIVADNEVIISQINFENINMKIRLIPFTCQQNKVLAIVCEEDIEQQYQRLQQQEQKLYQQRMATTIAHKLRTPLNCSMNMLQLMIEQEIVEENLINNYIQPALSTNLLLHSFINDICDQAQLEAGTFKLNMIHFDLQQLIKECLVVFQVQATMKQLELLMKYDVNMPAQIQSDSARIRQVIINLLSNAIKFSDHGQITIDVQYIELEKMAKVSISDQGLGISIQQLGNLFQTWKSSNMEDSDNMKNRGIAMGLQICSQIVKYLARDKQIDVASKLNQGCKMTFYIQNFDGIHQHVKDRNDDTFWEFYGRIISSETVKSEYKGKGGQQQLIGHDNEESNEKVVYNQVSVRKSTIILNQIELQKNLLEGMGFNSSLNNNIFNNNNGEQSSLASDSQSALAIIPQRKKSIQSISQKIKMRNQNQGTKTSLEQLMESQLESCNVEVEMDQGIQQQLFTLLPKFQGRQQQTKTKCNSSSIKKSSSDSQSKQGGDGCAGRSESGSGHGKGGGDVGCNGGCGGDGETGKQPMAQGDDGICSGKFFTQNSKSLYTINSKKQKVKKQKKKCLGEENKSPITIKSNHEGQMGNNSHVSFKIQQQQNAQTQKQHEKIGTFSEQNECKCSEILIVDDDIYNIFVLKNMLQVKNYIVDTAMNGQVAVDLVKHKYNHCKCCKNFWIIFMDIDMPIKNGYEASKEIQQFYQEMGGEDDDENQQPIICVSSAYVGEEDKQKARQQGIIYFIDKPISIQKLDGFLKEVNNQVSKSSLFN